MKKSEREIVKSVIVEASPLEVFRALTDENELPNWFPNAGAQLEPRVGGKVILRTQRQDNVEVHTIVGRILEFAAGKRFSHTWSIEGSPDTAESVVTWTLESFGDRRTKVTLVHSGQAEDNFADTDRGWSYFTGRLAEYCRRTTTDIKKTVMIDAPRNAVFEAITNPEELTRWFPDQAVVEPRKGGLVLFRFFENGKENHRVEGRVIEIVTDVKIVYSWKNLSDPNFPDTIVSWTLDSIGKKTRVTLVHSGFDPKGKWHGLHDQGWGYFVGRLERLMRGEVLDDKQEARELGDLPKPG